MKVACALRYQGVDTFAYLEHSHHGEWAFLEIKPCVQVEHGSPSRGLQGAECTPIRGSAARVCSAGFGGGDAAGRASPAGDRRREGGVETNRAVLAGVAAHAHWEERKCDTAWLERELRDVIRIGMELLKPPV
ncbi:hypothetical protein FIBSPDRAFT_951343 [Athelia psychrophila]|uniref:Uncharacterized protein n=1 Tax=Athelia psychrophila TaxID=1759441 RepID=A0A166MTJ1_9AGAM|nr:hypothetical protein FIBSPDRAFT_951343 [Fibularhizoctonia sp. CBS 109695]